ncbi:C2HC5 finger protein [Botrytis cinerea]
MSLAQLQNLLPLPEEDLKQVIDYANTLSKPAARDHFIDLLGESPGSIEFISSFNSRRQDPTAKATPQAQTYSQASAQSSAQGSTSGVPKSTRGPRKKKAPIHTPAPRQVHETYTGQGTAYKKKDEDDYVSRKSTPVSSSKASASPNTFTLDPTPSAIQAPIPRPPPSAAGTLISDFGKKSKSSASSRAASQNPSRNASPAPKTKINITGGNAMHGASTVLSDLDAAIRTLEISTNSSLASSDPAKRRCNCIATRHPLLAAAPNCLACGKVICVKEGLGPCTFCGADILGKDEIQSMIRTLREERGVEKQRLDASSHRRAETIGFQAQNAKRTTVRDEAADFDTSLAASVAVGGGSGMGGMWASPAERARELKRQQRVLAEQEWNARPEYEKRRQVVSVDLVGGKIVKRMAKIEAPKFGSEGEEEEEDLHVLETAGGGNVGGGTFSRNPLLGGLIRPVWTAKKVEGKGKEKETEGDGVNGEGEIVRKKKTWRRVQDDMDDNENIILDGGAFGGSEGKGNRREGAEEHAVG